MNFEEFKIEVLKRAKKSGACTTEYRKAAKSKTIDELIEVIKNNLGFVRDNQIVTIEMSKDYEKPELFNVGKENVGLFNSGYRNSGDLNSGDLNNGYRNSGDRNSGDRNSGDLNSGDLNNGYRNSGVFCTRKRTDTVPFFNKESQITWDEWYNHPAYNSSFRLNMTEWKYWDNMSDDERKENPKAFITDGMLVVLSYHEAWSNLWSTLSENEKESFKTLPNFDGSIFKEITGIEL